MKMGASQSDRLYEEITDLKKAFNVLSEVHVQLQTLNYWSFCLSPLLLLLLLLYIHMYNTPKQSVHPHMLTIIHVLKVLPHASIQCALGCTQILANK